jgi:hypothetical protein
MDGERNVEVLLKSTCPRVDAVEYDEHRRFTLRLPLSLGMLLPRQSPYFAAPVGLTSRENGAAPDNRRPYWNAPAGPSRNPVCAPTKMGRILAARPSFFR